MSVWPPVSDDELVPSDDGIIYMPNLQRQLIGLKKLLQADLTVRESGGEIDREVDDTQAELAQRWLYGGPPMKPDGMTDEEWEFWRRPEWTPEEIARIRVVRI